MSLSPTFATLQSSKARGTSSAVWTTSGFTIPSGSAVVILASFCGANPNGIGGSQIFCTPPSGLTLSTQGVSAASGTYDGGAAMFTGVTSSALTAATFGLQVKTSGGTPVSVGTWFFKLIWFTGQDTTTPFAGYVYSTVATPYYGARSITLAATPVSGDYALGFCSGFCADVGAVTSTPGSGFTEDSDDYDDDSIHVENEYRTGSTSTTVAWVDVVDQHTLASDVWLFGIIVKAATGGGTTYNVSISESGSAADSPSASRVSPGTITESGSAADSPTASGGNGVSILESGSASDSPSAIMTTSAAIAESGTAADSPGALKVLTAAMAESGLLVETVYLGALPIVTLKQHWYRPVGQTSMPPIAFGSNPMSITAGSWIVVVTSGADLGTQQGASLSTGTLIIPTNGQKNASGSDNIWMTFQYLTNSAGGSITVTPGGVGSGSGGEIAHWVYEIANMPATATIRSGGCYYQVTIGGGSPNSWTLTSGTEPQVNDLIITAAVYENTVAFTPSDLSDPPTTGYTAGGHAEQDGTNFTPTTVAYKMVTSSGAQTATWSTTDPTISEHIAMMMVVATNYTGGSTYSASVSESGTAADSPSALMSTSQTITESGTAADSPSGVKTTAAAITETGAASDTISQGANPTVVTLRQDWLKSWQDYTHANPILQSGGTNPFTNTAGDAIFTMTVGWDNTRQMPSASDNAGTISTISDGTTTAILHPTQITLRIDGEPNGSAGSHTITAPTDVAGVNGGDGETETWVVTVPNLGSTFSVRDVKAYYNASSAKTWSGNTGSSVRTGDLMLALGTYENSSGSVSGGLTTQSGWNPIAINNDATNFIPTVAQWKLVTADGVQSVSFTTTDNNKTEDYLLVVTLTPASSGNSYSVGVTESGTAADSPAASQTSTQSVTESGTAAETTSVARLSPGTITESGAAVDSPSAIMTTSAAVAESGTASDTVSTGALTSTSVTESGTASDSYTGAATFAAAVAEAAAALETVNGLQVSSVAVTEAGAASDSPSAVDTTSASVTEAGAASDSSTASASGVLVVTDSLTVSDAPGASASFVAAVTEAVLVAEVISAISNLNAVLSDSISASDAQSALAGGILAVAESALLLDSTSANALFQTGVAEIGAAADALGATAIFQAALSEVAAIIDAQSGFATSSVFVTEAGAVTDTINSTSGAILGVFDTLSATDSVSSSAVFAATLIEFANAADTQGVQRITSASITEALVVVENLFSPSTFTLSLTDTLFIGDNFTSHSSSDPDPVLRPGKRTVRSLPLVRTVYAQPLIRTVKVLP